jgi:hypothetical protein
MFIDSFEWRELPGCGCKLDGIEHVAMVREWQADPWTARLDRRIRQPRRRGPDAAPCPFTPSGSWRRSSSTAEQSSSSSCPSGPSSASIAPGWKPDTNGSTIEAAIARGSTLALATIGRRAEIRQGPARGGRA